MCAAKLMGIFKKCLSTQDKKQVSLHIGDTHFCSARCILQQRRQCLSSFVQFTNIARSICIPWWHSISSDDVREFKMTCRNDVAMSRNECHHSSTLFTPDRTQVPLPSLRGFFHIFHVLCTQCLILSVFSHEQMWVRTLWWYFCLLRAVKVAIKRDDPVYEPHYFMSGGQADWDCSGQSRHMAGPGPAVQSWILSLSSVLCEVYMFHARVM